MYCSNCHYNINNFNECSKIILGPLGPLFFTIKKFGHLRPVKNNIKNQKNKMHKINDMGMIEYYKCPEPNCPGEIHNEAVDANTVTLSCTLNIYDDAVPNESPHKYEMENSSGSLENIDKLYREAYECWEKEIASR